MSCSNPVSKGMNFCISGNYSKTNMFHMLLCYITSMCYQEDMGLEMGNYLNNQTHNNSKSRHKHCMMLKMSIMYINLDSLCTRCYHRTFASDRMISKLRSFHHHKQHHYKLKNNLNLPKNSSSLMYKPSNDLQRLSMWSIHHCKKHKQNLNQS